VLVIAIFVAQGKASIIYDMESLDNLYQAYYDGEIDYGTLTVLADAYNLHGLSQSDLEALGVFERQEISKIDLAAVDSRFWSRILSKRTGRIGVRRYSRDFDDITGNYYLDMKVARIESSMDIKESDGRKTLRRRTIGWIGDNIRVILGNYTIAEGYGLAIGRYDYQPSAGLEYDDDFDFLYPVNSYYNGLKLAIGGEMFGNRLYYSSKKYNDMKKTFYGSGANYKFGDFTGRLVVGWNRLTNKNGIDERTAAGMNFNYDHPGFNMTGEYAVIESSDGLYLKCEKRLNDVLIGSEFWRYGNNFNNYNCSGPAASDYISFYPRHSELGFRAAQSGETGLALNYLAKYAALGLQFWNHASERIINSAYNLLLTGQLVYRLNASLQTVGKSTESGGYLWSKIKLMPDMSLIDQIGAKGYFAGGSKLMNEKSYVFFILTKDLSDNLDIDLKVRSYFDSHLTWYLGEELTTVSGMNIIAEINFDRYIRVNLKIEKML